MYSSFTRDGHLCHLVNFFSTSTVTNPRGHTAKINKPHLDLQCDAIAYSVIDKWNELLQSNIESRSTLSRTGSTSWWRIRWAFSWTSRSTWPNGLISSEGFRRAGAAYVKLNSGLSPNFRVQL